MAAFFTEVQAKLSVEAIARGKIDEGKPAHMHYVLKLKEGHKMEDTLADLDGYTKYAKAVPGKIVSHHTILDDEMHFFEVMAGYFRDAYCFLL